MPSMCILLTALTLVALGSGVAGTAVSTGAAGTAVSKPWAGTSVQDLHREYGNIFKFGNRNAASHLWSTFLLERSAQMNPDRIELMFSGFCAISGSPVRANDYNRYKLTLPLVSGEGHRTGALHYCCWPCVCDTQDYIRVDTKTIDTAGGGRRQYHFAVIGNPCDHPEKLDEPFVQPFDRRRTTLAREAREVRCGASGELIGATVSDHGFIIIGMFFDLLANEDDALAIEVPVPDAEVPTPGRVRTFAGKLVQDEFEFAPRCSSRAAAGYNSGMGEIFRKVADISPIRIPAPDADAQPKAIAGSPEGDEAQLVAKDQQCTEQSPSSSCPPAAAAKPKVPDDVAE